MSLNTFDFYIIYATAGSLKRPLNALCKVIGKSKNNIETRIIGRKVYSPRHSYPEVRHRLDLAFLDAPRTNKDEVDATISKYEEAAQGIPDVRIYAEYICRD